MIILAWIGGATVLTVGLCAVVLAMTMLGMGVK